MSRGDRFLFSISIFLTIISTLSMFFLGYTFRNEDSLSDKAFGTYLYIFSFIYSFHPLYLFYFIYTQRFFFFHILVSFSSIFSILSFLYTIRIYLNIQ
ncbi:MAG: hypothetical protein KDK54_19040 [Leptospiraceae bacterium]|nr:hypothetical protein [Leptospiraceae bacterium]